MPLAAAAVAPLDPLDPTDLLNGLIPLAADSPIHALRLQRDKVADATAGSYRALFAPLLGGLTLSERLLAAHSVARLSGVRPLSEHYRAQLLASPALSSAERALLDADQARASEPRLHAILNFSQTLNERALDSDRKTLHQLAAAGLSTADVVTLAQLVAFVAYQSRLLAGLQALVAVDQPSHDDAAPLAPIIDSVPVAHPVTLPPPGAPLRVGGYTSQTLAWKAWLPIVDLAQATPEQLAVLDASHPQAKSSDYYLLLAHQPRILRERSAVFNAIMYAPGGLPRAERELASTVVSRVNGCVYCASVHAQRFEQLSKRNDTIHQVFSDPETAGTTPREQAIVRLAIDLTSAPAAFASTPLHALRAAGLTDLEMLDLIHAVAIFAWANRLMLKLGEAVFPR